MLSLPAFEQGSLPKTCQFMSYTRANKTRQGKLGRLYGALNQGKLVQLYTRAIKTCQGKLLGKNLFVVHTSKGKPTRNLSRKTWSSVQGFNNKLESNGYLGINLATSPWA